MRGTEKITIRILNAHTFEDAAGNGIVSVPLIGQLSKFAYIDPYWSDVLDRVADFIILGIGSLGVINLIAAQYWKASTTSYWTTLVYLQMITFVPLLSANWPSFVDTFFGKLGLAINGEFSSVPNPIYDKAIAQTGKKTRLEAPLNARFADFGRDYSNFFFLTGKKVLIWLILFGCYPLIWYLKRNYANKHKFCKLWESIEQKFRYNLLMRGIIISYLSMVMASTLNIYRMSFINMQTTISCFVSISFQISMIYLPILIMNIL